VPAPTSGVELGEFSDDRVQLCRLNVGNPSFFWGVLAQPSAKINDAVRDKK
jgi:hypothetical protein